MYCFHPPTAIVATKPSNEFVFVCSNRIVEKGWRQYATLADSDCCLKPFKCVIIGHVRSGALEVFNYINQLSPIVCFFVTSISSKSIGRFQSMNCVTLLVFLLWRL